MGKDKFKKRKERRRLIRGEMTKRGISGKEIAAQTGLTESAVSQGCATSPRVREALIKAGLPARLFGKATAAQPSPSGGEGEGVSGNDGQVRGQADDVGERAG
jgi:hypothetical protein